MRYAIIFTGLLLACAVHAESRLYLLSQYDWGKKTGFYLDFEGDKLAALPLILGVADGTQWQFTKSTAKFVVGHEYAVHAVIGPAAATLDMDGQRVGDLQLAWQPMAGPLVVNDSPPWARGGADWLPVMTAAAATLARADKQVARCDFTFGAEVPDALRFFEPSSPQNLALPSQPGDTVTVDLKFKFIDADLHSHAPFIDKFGQARAAEFAEKVKSEEDLKGDIAGEDAELAKMPAAPQLDRYGGWKRSPWKEAATGFFRAMRHNGKWWLISPDGNPCFFQGVCGPPATTWETTPVTGREFLFESLPPHDGALGAAWARNCWGTTDGTEYCCFYEANLIRKYGDGWEQKATDRAYRRLQAVGLQGGKWGCGVPLAETPVLHHWDTPNLVKHPDIFDAAIQKRLRDDLSAQITPRRADPRVVGWSYGNEYDELITRAELKEVIKRGDSPARRALFAQALKQSYGGDLGKLAQAWQVPAADLAALNTSTPQVPEADQETMRLYYESRYHQFVYETVKAIDPNHLYLGFWIVPGWWESPADWAATTPYCDVIGYDRYDRQFADEEFAKLLAQSDKPALCGEFSLPAWYDGQRGFGRYGTFAQDEEEAGKLYQSWVRDAAANPYCVGLIWFIYRDQPLTGRGPGKGEQLVIGEHYAFGLVTGTDRLKWPLARAIRETTGQAAQWRLEK